MIEARQQFRLSSLDTPRQRQIVMEVLTPGIHDLMLKRTKEQQQENRDRLWRRFRELDTEMTSVIRRCGTDHDLVMWAAMLHCYMTEGFERLDHSLVHWGTPRCDMTQAALGEAFLEAGIKSTESTLMQY